MNRRAGSILWAAAAGWACAAGLAGCESGGSTKRNVDVLYRFEGLRKGNGLDEWGAIKPVLEKNAVGGVKETRLDRRTLGGVEVATYEARVTLPSVREIERVQIALEGLARPGRKDRVEAYLTQVGAVYRTNFVAATASVTVSGVGVRGHVVRLYWNSAQPPLETTVGASGVWVGTLPAAPEGGWVYGVSMDRQARVPPRYFRVNVTTRSQETVEEPEFLRMFPGALSPQGVIPGKAGEVARPNAETPDERALRAKREAEEERVRRARQKEEEARRRRAERK